MIKQFVAVCVALCSTAVVAEERRVDAFLSRTEQRSLVDERELSPMARAALRAGLVSSTEPRLGVPTFFWTTRPPGARSFRAMGLSPEQAARRYLYTHAELYRGDPVRWAEARLQHVHDLGDGAVIVSFQLDVGGTRVFRDEVRLVMSSQLELVAIAGFLTPQRRVLGDFLLHPESAIASAFQDLTGRGLEPTRLTPLPPEHGYLRFALEGEPTPVRVRRVYFPTPDGLEPGLYVEVELSRDTDSAYFSFVVSATSGALLYRKNLTAADVYSYRVWADATSLHAPLDGPQGNGPTPHPTGQPDSYQPPYVAQSLISLQNGPISTNDPWLPAGATATQGNNAKAYADLARPNGFGSGDVMPAVTAPGVFDRVYDVTRSPSASTDQRQAAVTQLFYDINFFHDWFYDEGFDEAAGNAQASNLGRGGAGNDAMNAEGEDYSGTSNANMSTPSDGASPRMQMYVFPGATNAGLLLNTSPTQQLAAGAATFGPQAFTVTADVVLVNDGSTSNGGTTTDACTASFTTSVTGKIALIDRGQCTFITKVQNAATNGAVGVIIADNTADTAPPDLFGTGTATIPALSVTQQDGTTVKGLLTAGQLSVTLTRAASFDRDGTLDNSIVAHEWGHYISNRLIGDANGISNNQGVGMGEGWGDFHSLLLVVKEGDDQVASNAAWAGVYGLPGYAGGGDEPNSYYFGFRRVPYSTDLAKNGLTFKHIQNGVALPRTVPTAFGQSGTNNAESHNTGEVWATMLWECYAALLRDSPRLSFTQAQERMLRYLVAAYKATPLMPTFVEARDAMLAVAAANDLADFALFWRAFAKRGIGMLAVAPDRDVTNNGPVVESFDVGNMLQIVDVRIDDSVRSCDSDGILDNGEEGQLTVTVKNIGISALANATLTASTGAAGITFPGGATATFAPTQPFATATARLRIAAASQHGATGITVQLSVADASLIGGRAVTRDGLFRVNFNTVSNGTAVDDVEAPSSKWTVANDPAGNTGSDWRVFASSATQHWWFGPNPASPADTWLVSPALEVGSGAPFVITFKHRWDFEKDATTFYDGGVLELSTDDGQTWTDIGAAARPGYTGALSNQGANPLGGQRAYVGKSAGYPAFITETVDLGTSYATRTVKLRFRIGADDAAAAKGWEIDDIGFQGITNKPFTSVVNDPNSCSSNRAPTLTVGPDLEVVEGDPVAMTATGNDPDGDPVTFLWVQRSGPAVTLTGGSFTAPQVPADTLLIFEVSATDGILDSAPGQVKVLVHNVNRPPSASAPALLEVNEGDVATVQGTGTDPDGDPLTYTWTQTGGPTVTLAGQGTDKLTFTAPEVDGNTIVAFDFTVQDATLASTTHVEVLVHNLTVAYVNQEFPAKPGCGCSGQVGLAPLLGVLALLRRRRRA